MSKEAVVSHHNTEEIKLKAYVIGFVSSVVLTLITYFLVVNQSLSRTKLIFVIFTLALVQFTVQLIYFLHLAAERNPRWKFVVFIFMVGTVLILVLGSIWIMDNLNYHMLTGHQLEEHMHTEEGL